MLLGSVLLSTSTMATAHSVSFANTATDLLLVVFEVVLSKGLVVGAMVGGAV